MSRVCTVCAYPQVVDVDRAIAGGEALASIAERHDLGRSALSRHRERHVSAALAAVQVVDAVPVGGSVADRVAALVGRCERLIATAEAAGSSSAALAAMAECRRLLELTAKITGELDERPQVAVLNLAQSAEWQDIQGRIMAALEPYPAARLAVAQAVAR